MSTPGLTIFMAPLLTQFSPLPGEFEHVRSVFTAYTLVSVQTFFFVIAKSKKKTV